MRFCTDCGQPRHAAETFCTACGRPFEDALGLGELQGRGARRFAPHLVAVWVVAVLVVGGGVTAAVVVATRSGDTPAADGGGLPLGLPGGGAPSTGWGIFGGSG